MILIRSIIYFILLVITSLVFATAIITVGLLLTYKQRSNIANHWGMLNIWLVAKICGLKYEITGLENIPDSACIIMSKHQSTWDTMFLRGILPPEQAWVLKKELMHVPFFGWGLMAVQAIGIDRKAGRQAINQIIRLGSERLEKGHYVIIYPEGTRVAPGERKKYGISGALLAHKSKYPIIPIAHNAGVFWRRMGLKKYPGTIQVVIGKPIKVDGLKSSEINSLVEEWIESTSATMPRSLSD
ncbi:Acyl-CoA:1-acyl-sn-glycerol-3-phosphate acyltransferase [hydrothermal vent metagenome]|uniref:Acyl-CoA:1-acyl-sn-glycerol-3-phosphate acyltransferase n=1 Tax=hydrothermal vent metagenome TaxID=652676 RepID=A0A3B1BEF0_9ZZZZ